MFQLNVLDYLPACEWCCSRWSGIVERGQVNRYIEKKKPRAAIHNIYIYITNTHSHSENNNYNNRSKCSVEARSKKEKQIDI